MIDRRRKKVSHEFLAAIKNQEQDVPDAKANTRATHMFAEMLAIVCHPEYYQQGEQTVTLQMKRMSDVRLLLSTLPVSKRRFTGQPTHPTRCGHQHTHWSQIVCSSIYHRNIK